MGEGVCMPSFMILMKGRNAEGDWDFYIYIKELIDTGLFKEVVRSVMSVV